MDAIPDVVDLVLWSLALLSVLTWSIIIFKSYKFWQDTRASKTFITEFEKISHIRQLQPLLGLSTSTVTRTCTTGANEIRSLNQVQFSHLAVKEQHDLLHHTLRQQIQKEQSHLENGLAILASIGSTSPFIGLFGTVWGIMHALKSISISGSAGLDVVAGPIGEALIATAMGIIAAIPAVLAYNYFLRKIRLAVADMDYIADRFMHLVIKSKGD